ncbi:MAG: HD domain-containing protein [Chloroflexi bacterium]|jgi:predicted HD superfamily hydrolase involved in NAD metabolism|nr:HD domain-containing protein [Chloroflexota bacterium]
MQRFLTALTEGITLTGDIPTDARALLVGHHCERTLEHTRRVVAEATRLAARFGVSPARAELAAWLHDISAVFPSAGRLVAARELGVPLLPAEIACPMITHQKLSAALAQQLLGVQDQGVLDAVRCHTTLRADATLLDKVVFLADKLEWDQAGKPPYLDDVLAALGRSLDEAVFCYVDYLWQRRETLPVVHPWLAEAHAQLVTRVGQRD